MERFMKAIACSFHIFSLRFGGKEGFPGGGDDARSVGCARPACARVHHDFARGAGKSFGARALEREQAVGARAAVETGRGTAFVQIGVA